MAGGGEKPGWGVGATPYRLCQKAKRARKIKKGKHLAIDPADYLLPWEGRDLAKHTYVRVYEVSCPVAQDPSCVLYRSTSPIINRAPPRTTLSP